MDLPSNYHNGSTTGAGGKRKRRNCVPILNEVVETPLHREVCLNPLHESHTQLVKIHLSATVTHMHVLEQLHVVLYVYALAIHHKLMDLRLPMTI